MHRDGSQRNRRECRLFDSLDIIVCHLPGQGGGAPNHAQVPTVDLALVRAKAGCIHPDPALQPVLLTRSDRSPLRRLVDSHGHERALRPTDRRHTHHPEEVLILRQKDRPWWKNSAIFERHLKGEREGVLLLVLGGHGLTELSDHATDPFAARSSRHRVCAIDDVGEVVGTKAVVFDACPLAPAVELGGPGLGVGHHEAEHHRAAGELGLDCGEVERRNALGFIEHKEVMLCVGALGALCSLPSTV